MCSLSRPNSNCHEDKLYPPIQPACAPGMSDRITLETALLERIDTLTRTVQRLADRVEDLEDNRDLEQAIADCGGKPLVAWDKAKGLFDLD